MQFDGFSLASDNDTLFRNSYIGICVTAFGVKRNSNTDTNRTYKIISQF